AELAAALHAYLDDPRVSGPAAVRAGGASTPAGARARRLALAAGVVLLAGLAGGLWLWSGPGADPFRAGSIWEGPFRFLPPIEGFNGSVRLTVTERSGQHFRAVYDTGSGHQWEAAGTARGGSVRWELVKALTDGAARAGNTRRTVVEGDYTGGQM